MRHLLEERAEELYWLEDPASRKRGGYWKRHGITVEFDEHLIEGDTHPDGKMRIKYMHNIFKMFNVKNLAIPSRHEVYGEPDVVGMLENERLASYKPRECV